MRLLIDKTDLDKKQVTYNIVLLADDEIYSQKAIMKIEQKILDLSKKYKSQPIIYDRRDNPFHKIVIFSTT